MELVAKLSAKETRGESLILHYLAFERVTLSKTKTELREVAGEAFDVVFDPAAMIGNDTEIVPESIIDPETGVEQLKDKEVPVVRNFLTQDWLDGRVRERLKEIQARLDPQAAPAADLSGVDLETGTTAREINLAE